MRPHTPVWAVALLLLAACGSEPVVIPDEPLRAGDRLPAGIALPASEDPLAPQDITARFGSTATVFCAWSVPCPCVENAEARIQKLIAKYGPGVTWIAVAGEPLDTLEQIHEKRLRLGSPYPILLDPQQKLCRLLRFDSACQVAVFDGERRLVYGGAIDQDYVEGKGEYLVQALDALVAGKPIPESYRARTYGCTFNDPASCTQLPR